MPRHGGQKPGFTRLELILTGAGILVLGVLLILAVADTRRRSRDAVRVSQVRQAQFDLLRFRSERASYPASLEALYGPSAPFEYRALPEGCAPGTERLCSSYVLAFELEGAVGALRGGSCEASPDGISCVP